MKNMKWAKVGGWSLLAVLLIAWNMKNTQVAFGAQETVAAEAESQAEAVVEPGEWTTISSCVTDGTNVKVTGTNEGTSPAPYDDYLYLFELKPYQDYIDDRTDYCAWIKKGSDVSFSVPLYKGTEKDRLYSRFVVAVFDGTKYHEISEQMYITNPEVLAKNTAEFKDPSTKKGLLIENSMLADAFELGVKHVIVNFSFQQILGSGIEYTYDGKTYHFNKSLMEQYDYTIMRMSEKGMLVTAVILNGWNDNHPELIYPGVEKTSSANYYAFNAATEEGYETLKAIASFLADRYSGKNNQYGKVSNWIIGNEINNQQWNYIGPMGIENYVWEYERAFRVFYTAIKSTNKNDRVYFSTDFNWNYDADGQLKYNAKDIVDQFNSKLKRRGQMDWGLAYHPYSIPLTEPEFWDDDKTGLITNTSSSPVVNFKNLNVLTDYMASADLRMSNGEVRPIILSEQGFTSYSITRGKNNALQAAAFAYAYYIADSNPHIDAFIMSRQVDAPSEAKQSLNFGLWECDMNAAGIEATMRKQIWSTFKAIDGPKSLEATEFAKEIIGINKWSDVIPDFKHKAKE
ncbi:MAG: DUF5722 domain-containing protein [Lachnospiraceae bacterium]